jgi:hypothetical protein
VLWAIPFSWLSFFADEILLCERFLLMLVNEVAQASVCAGFNFGVSAQGVEVFPGFLK